MSTTYDQAAYPNQSEANGKRDSKLVDPVAILRAANGEREVYDALTYHERRVFWDWFGEDHSLRTAVGERLGLTTAQRKTASESAGRRRREGRATEFDPGLWAELVPFHRPDDVVWSEFYGHPMKGNVVQFPPTKYDPQRRFVSDAAPVVGR